MQKIFWRKRMVESINENDEWHICTIFAQYYTDVVEVFHGLVHEWGTGEIDRSRVQSLSHLCGKGGAADKELGLPVDPHSLLHP